MTTWQDAPIVFTVALHCPSCLSTATPISIRVQRENDGSRSRRYVCSKCSRKFVWVVEPPERLPKYGNPVDDIL